MDCDFRGMVHRSICIITMTGETLSPSTARYVRLCPRDLWPHALNITFRLETAETFLRASRRSHVPWDPFKNKDLLGENKGTKSKRAGREGGPAATLDPLGVLIMGKMPGVNEGKIIPM